MLSQVQSMCGMSWERGDSRVYSSGQERGRQGVISSSNGGFEAVRERERERSKEG